MPARPRVPGSSAALLHSLRNFGDSGVDDDGLATGRIHQARSAVGYVEDGFELYKRGRQWWERKSRWTVSVDSKDRLYDVVLRWFLDTDTEGTESARAIKAVLGANSGRARLAQLFNEDDGEDQIDVLYDEKGSREIVLDGHRITVSMYRPEQIAASNEPSSFRSVEPDRIQFHAKSEEGQHAVLGLLRNIATDMNARKPGLHLMSQWGDWQRRDDLPERQLSSVVLKAGQMERLRDDLEDFLSREDQYVRRGTPYHRGYLLHGPPGTGKTSIVRALAAHFGLDLWYAPLGDLQKDTSLITLVNQVRSNSILLLEDVDVFHATRNRDDDDGGVSMAGLLNALDGVATPHGLIVFMTTNDMSVIDDAVIRPGRIDMREEIGYPDPDQIARLWESWYDLILDPEDRELIRYSDTTAAVTELFKQNLDDAAAALEILQRRVLDADERSVNTLAIGEDNGGRPARQRTEGRRLQGGEPF